MDKQLHLSESVEEIVYPFPNFNACAAEVWEWISNSIAHFIGYKITYCELCLALVCDGAPLVVRETVESWPAFCDTN